VTRVFGKTDREGAALSFKSAPSRMVNNSLKDTAGSDSEREAVRRYFFSYPGSLGESDGFERVGDIWLLMQPTVESRVYPGRVSAEIG
jgi:hypothetical protein